MRCNNAVNQTVPFPKHWTTVIPIALHAKKLLQEAVARAREKHKNPTITCELMGIPVDSDRLDALSGRESGTLVRVQSADTEMPQEFLLAAHVQGNTWVCHPGSDDSGRLCAASPFAVQDLVARDIPAERLLEDAGASRKRRRMSSKTLCRDLMEAAASNPSAWSAARAHALWMAEEIRASASDANQGFQLDQACAGYDKDLFQADVCKSGRFSQTQLAFQWAWRSRGRLHRGVVFVRANHLLKDERHIPRPEALKEPWEIWRTRLEDAAAKHLFCRYLGVQVGPAFEPDPQKWKVRPGQNKAFLTVWYEWEHITRGPENKPYRVEIVANDILHHNRNVPFHPCSPSCPRELRFDVEYMQGMAKWKSGANSNEHAQYVGISYESDRPAFQYEVPDGGLDIQDQPVYWQFANGVDLFSLRQVYSMSEANFEIQGEVDERYLNLGSQMGWDLLGICEDEISLAEYDSHRLKHFPIYSCMPRPPSTPAHLLHTCVHLCVYLHSLPYLSCGCTRYLNNRGTLAEERWKALKWTKPEDETVQCWWLVLTVKLACIVVTRFPCSSHVQ